MTTSNEMNWDDFSKYVADKKIDFLTNEETSLEVKEVQGYDDIPEDEQEKIFLHDSLYLCLCILKQVSVKTGVKTFKVSEHDIEVLGAIPYMVNELPNGDMYLTFEDKYDGT